MKKKAVIFGISGQDGAYLANFLVGKNYKIIGITRNLSKKNLLWHPTIKIYDGLIKTINYFDQLLKKE